MTPEEVVIGGALKEYVDLVGKYESAIRKHRDYRGDDRCFLDDGELYAVLPEGDTRPPEEMAVTPENCLRFIACRQQGKGYISPQRHVERLEALVRSAEAMIEAKDKQIINLFERIGGQSHIITNLIEAGKVPDSMREEIARWLNEGNPNG